MVFWAASVLQEAAILQPFSGHFFSPLVPLQWFFQFRGPVRDRPPRPG